MVYKMLVFYSQFFSPSFKLSSIYPFFILPPSSSLRKRIVKKYIERSYRTLEQSMGGSNLNLPNPATQWDFFVIFKKTQKGLFSSSLLLKKILRKHPFVGVEK
jgi:hypothetical protein